MITPVELRFYATPDYLETFAKSQRSGGVSIFDPQYPASIAPNYYYLYQDQYDYHYEALDHAEQVTERLRAQAIEALTNNVSTDELKVQSVINTLEYDINSNEARWLNSHISQGVQIFDFLENSQQSGEEFAKLAVSYWIINPNASVDFVEKIFNNLTGKALCIYNDIESLSTSFNNAIKKFEPEFPVAHLKFKMGDLGNTRATTDAPDGVNGNNTSPDYVITITLNNNSNKHRVDYRPNLMTVKTIAHEVIHAEMYRKLLSVLDNGGNISGVTRQDILDALDGNFPGMYDYFMRHKNWQHQQMATHYRDAIARIMQEYDTGYPVPNNQQPSQLYMDLAWEGLIYEKGTNAIYTWTNLLQPEKDRIKGVISSYIDNNKNENCN